MKESPPSPTIFGPIGRLFAIFIAWISLAGIADNLLTWRQWFDRGFMMHYNSVKLWILENVFFWLPFEIPVYFFEYSVISMIFVRMNTCSPKIFAMYVMKTPTSVPINNKSLYADLLKNVLLSFVWPLQIAFLIKNAIALKKRQRTFDIKNTGENMASVFESYFDRKQLKEISIIILVFVVSVFIVSDILNKFQWL